MQARSTQRMGAHLCVSGARRCCAAFVPRLVRGAHTRSPLPRRPPCLPIVATCAVFVSSFLPICLVAFSPLWQVSPIAVNVELLPLASAAFPRGKPGETAQVLGDLLNSLAYAFHLSSLFSSPFLLFFNLFSSFSIFVALAPCHA